MTLTVSVATCEKLWHVSGAEETSHASVGELIKIRREDRGLNQAQLAEAIGVTREYLSRWENDHNAPGSKHAASLAHVLGGEAAEYQGLAGAPRNLREVVEQLERRVERLEANH